jgi:hypothetical protein
VFENGSVLIGKVDWDCSGTYVDRVGLNMYEEWKMKQAYESLTAEREQVRKIDSMSYRRLGILLFFPFCS